MGPPEDWEALTEDERAAWAEEFLPASGAFEHTGAASDVQTSSPDRECRATG
jgi:hypothetical protein